MEKHIHILGIIFMISGILGVFGAIVVFTVFVGGGAFATAASGESLPAVIAGIFGTFLTLFIVITSLPALIAGYGLLKRKSWGRLVGIIVSIVKLFGFPIGTAIGIYGLWVLFHEETVQLLSSAKHPGTGYTA